MSVWRDRTVDLAFADQRGGVRGAVFDSCAYARGSGCTVAGMDIGREHTARLMRLADVPGTGKSRSAVTIHKPKGRTLALTWCGVNFNLQHLDRLWVADMTYVHAKIGFVYSTVVTDVKSRSVA